MLKRVSTFLLATIVVFAVSISAFADTDNVSNRQRQGETFVLPINSVEISENSWVKIGGYLIIRLERNLYSMLQYTEMVHQKSVRFICIGLVPIYIMHGNLLKLL